MYYGSDYYETDTYARQFCLCFYVCDEAVGVQKDSGSIKSLNECQLFSSIYWLMGICEVSDCSLVNCHQGRRLMVASGATAPGPALEGAPRFRPMSL